MLIGEEKKEQPLNQKTANSNTRAMIAFCSLDTSSPSERILLRRTAP